MADTSRVTRVEVIDDFGRSYVAMRQTRVEISLQDDGRTLKIFTTDATKPFPKVGEGEA